MVSAVGPAAAAVYNSVICTPIRWICDKIRQLAVAIFGYLLRIVTFQLGEMKVRGAYIIMRIYQRLSSDPRDEKPFDAKRLGESKKLLTQFGGVESIVLPSDGGAQIRATVFKSADFFNAFRQLGSESIDIMHEGRARKALLNPPPQAAKFYFPRIDIRMPNGQLVKGALLPESPPGNGPRPMILHCHSPGRSKDMDRRDIGKFLGAGYDITVWDPRGTVESTGSPSEGGYYLDAEAVFQHVLNQGYLPNRIYVSGFCEGAAVAAHLKKRFHHLGANFIGSNLYTSMKDVVKGYGWLGRLGAHYGLPALQDSKIAVPQDYFNNEEKFRNLPASEGKFILIHTDTDKMMPRGTVQKLCEVIDKAGPVHEILRVHPNPKINGHIDPPYQDDIVWRRLVQFVT